MGLLKRRIIEAMEPNEEPPTDRSDIVYRLQSVMADLDAEERDEAASEIVRLRREVAILRLTPEECDAICEAIQGYSAWMLDHVSLDRDDTQAVLYRLNGILERHAPPEVK